MPSHQEAMKWCNENVDEIKKYCQMFLAISLKDGIVLADGNEKSFLETIAKKYSKEERANLFLTNSFAFGSGYDHPAKLRKLARDAIVVRNYNKAKL